MNTEAHLAAGWLIANLGGEDRRFRALVTLSALLFSGGAMLLWRHRPGKILLLTQLGFYTHYFGDYFFTRFPLVYFWPISRAEYIFSFTPRLDDPVNTALGYLSLVLIVLLAIAYRRTPLEMVWPELDRRVVNLFSRKRLACNECGAKANEHCEDCRQPVCMRHARLTARARIRCRTCHEQRSRAARTHR